MDKIENEDDHNSSLVGGPEDAWVDAEAVRRFGIKLEDPLM